MKNTTTAVHRCECGLEFETADDLAIHREITRRFKEDAAPPPPGVYRCPRCGAEYETMAAFRAHLWDRAECSRVVARQMLRFRLAREFLEMYRAAPTEEAAT